MIALVIATVLTLPLDADASFFVVGESVKTDKQASAVLARRAKKNIPATTGESELFSGAPPQRVTVVYGGFADEPAAARLQATLKKQGVRARVRRLARPDQRLLRVWGQLGDVLLHPTKLEIKSATDTAVTRTDKDGWYQALVAVPTDTSGQLSLKADFYPGPGYNATSCSTFANDEGSETFSATTADLRSVWSPGANCCQP